MSSDNSYAESDQHQSQLPSRVRGTAMCLASVGGLVVSFLSMIRYHSHIESVAVFLLFVAIFWGGVRLSSADGSLRGWLKSKISRSDTPFRVGMCLTAGGGAGVGYLLSEVSNSTTTSLETVSWGGLISTSVLALGLVLMLKTSAPNKEIDVK